MMVRQSWIISPLYHIYLSNQLLLIYELLTFQIACLIT